MTEVALLFHFGLDEVIDLRGLPLLDRLVRQAIVASFETVIFLVIEPEIDIEHAHLPEPDRELELVFELEPLIDR